MLPISIVLAALIIGGAFIYSRGLNLNRNSEQLPGSSTQSNSANLIVLDTSEGQPILGKNEAPITIFEFGDYQCPYCRRFYLLTHLDLIKDYVKTGLIKIVFIDVPLPGHEFAQKASEAAWCAKDQNKYWEMHDELYSNADETNGLTVDNIIKYAAKLGLDTAKFSDCLNSSQYAAKVQQMLNLASQLGIYGTPSTIIANQSSLKVDGAMIRQAFETNNYQADIGGGAILVIGAQPFNTIKSIVDSFLK